LQAIIVVRERVLGPEAVATLESRANLAAVLAEEKKFAPAESEHRKVLTIRERVLGPDHLDVSMSCFNFALCLEKQKRNAEALALAERSLEVRLKKLGPNHPDTKNSQKLVARLSAAAK
jgi:hypothetical protein